MFGYFKECCWRKKKKKLVKIKTSNVLINLAYFPRTEFSRITLRSLNAPFAVTGFDV